MRNAYVTKRCAPQGYVAVTKPLAAVLYEQGYAVTICGSNVNCYHVFKGWCLGCTIDKAYTEERMIIKEDRTFNRIMASYVNSSASELLRYPVFYVRKEVINNMDLSLLEKEKV